MLKYLLDTNICIYIANKHPQSVLTKLEHLTAGELGMSIITHGKLFYGAWKSHHTEKSLAILHELTTLIPALPLPPLAGEYYGRTRRELELQGKPIGNNDLWIASHALALDVTLVSNNLNEFSRISALKYEHWI